jgi:hypothetical protein
MAAGAALVTSSGVAGAATTPPQPTVAYLGGAVVSNGTTATVRLAYTCSSEASPLNHLFVAVKQGPGISPSTPSSGPTTTAFLSTNWSSDAGPNALTCDGRRHVQKVVLQQQGYGPLVTGSALVQICLYDNVTDFSSEEPDGGFDASYTMERVVVTHAPSR